MTNIPDNFVSAEWSSDGKYVWFYLGKEKDTYYPEENWYSDNYHIVPKSLLTDD